MGPQGPGRPSLFVPDYELCPSVCSMVMLAVRPLWATRARNLHKRSQACNTNPRIMFFHMVKLW